MSRLNGMDDDASLTDEQREIRREIAERRGGFLPRPHAVWTYRPELARHAQELGLYFNSRSSLPVRLSELAMLLVAWHWRAEYAWRTHLPRALEAGLSEAALSAIKEGATPEFTAEDEGVVYDFVTALQAGKEVDDGLYERGIRVLGRDGVVDLTALTGYFSMVAATVKVFRL